MPARIHTLPGYGVAVRQCLEHALAEGECEERDQASRREPLQRWHGVPYISVRMRG